MLIYSNTLSSYNFLYNSQHLATKSKSRNLSCLFIISFSYSSYLEMNLNLKFNVQRKSNSLKECKEEKKEDSGVHFQILDLQYIFVDRDFYH